MCDRVKASLAAGLCCTMAVLACGADEDTSRGGLLIVIDSDLAIPKDIDHVALDVTAHEQSLLHAYEQVGAGHLLIPAQWKVAASERSAVTVRALAYRDGVPKIERRAVTTIPRTHVGVLRLPLQYLCDDTAQSDGSSTCGANETCILGTCRGAEISTDGSAGQQTESVTAANSSSGCFDVRACMLEAQSVQLDSESCTFALPESADLARLNIALVLPPGDLGICDDQACYVALDRDEDWSIEGAHVQLPPGVCQRMAEHRFEVRLTTTCATKTTRVPVCGDWSPITTPIESPIGPACRDSSESSCGKCGVKTRTCRDGRWTAFGPCQGEGECLEGEERSCGSEGVQRCNALCKWDEACVDQRCSGAATQSCGNCLSGTQTRSCDPSTGKWSPWSTCSGDGECAPKQTRDCGVQGKETCGDDCHWGSTCAGQRCAPEGSTTRPCGNCMSGTQTRSCDANSGMWSPWSSCVGALPCAPTQTHSCGSGGIQSCGDDCRWEPECRGQACLPEGPTSRSCGNCDLGRQLRSCDTNSGKWSEWTTCSGGGACSAGETQLCGSNGTQTCGSDCQWAPQCRGQTCLPVGPAARRCGNCNLGTQSRTCNTDTAQWSAWSACTGGGVCSPSATQPCGEGGMQQCTDACTWGPCGCAGPSSQACGRCGGTQTRTCNEGEWSPWGKCSHPAGGPAGGYDFDMGSAEGWTFGGNSLIYTDASVPESHSFGPTPAEWNDRNQEGSPIDGDTNPQRGALRLLINEGPVVLDGRSTMLINVTSPPLDAMSPFQNHSTIRFAALFGGASETNHPITAQAELDVRMCDGTSSSVESGSCTIQRGAWSSCRLPISLTNVDMVTQLQLYFVLEKDTYDDEVFLDSIRAE